MMAIDFELVKTWKERVMERLKRSTVVITILENKTEIVLCS